MRYSWCPYYKQVGWEDSDGAVPYLICTLAFATFVFVVETYLDHRQMRKFNHKYAKIPERLQGVIEIDTLEKSLAYRRDAFSLKLWEGAFAFTCSIAMLLLGYLPWAWDEAVQASYPLVSVVGFDLNAWSPFYVECLTTYLFVAIFTLTDTVLTLPFSLYSTFVVEQRHGFNKSTLLLYLQDKLTVIFLSLALSGPVLCAVIFLVRWGGPYFFIYVWIFLLCVSLLLMTLYPVLIAPLFNKYTPLPEGATRDAVHALAAQLRFPLTALYSVDGSRRSAHSNAYLFGLPMLGQRIVLYDTLLKQVTLEELLAILAHEIGHWQLWHTATNFSLSQLYTLALLSSFASLQHSAGIFRAFGFSTASGAEAPVFVALLLFMQTFWAPIDKIFSLFMTLGSRQNEFAADHFAVQGGRGEALVTGLIKLSAENLDNLVPDSWYSWYHYSHPPLVERIAAIEAASKKAK